VDNLNNGGAAPLLQVNGLSVSFRSEGGLVRPVRDVSFEIGKGETVGLVGESGSGKSVLSFALMGLLPPHNSRIDGGEVLMDGRDLSRLRRRAMSKLRGRDISMIFQEPMTSLNPVYTIGNQIEEVFRNHTSMGKKERRERAIDLLERVGVPRAPEIMASYPHQLSGGMRQRVMIVMAIALKPRLLIADEPTTALDVTVQAQILRLIGRLAEEDGMAVILISHNLGVIARVCQRVMVMYAGQLVEVAPAAELYRHPRHPYTRHLFECIPRIGMGGHRLNYIEGSVPHPGDELPGCRFAPRCREADEGCLEREPELAALSEGRASRCLKEGGAGFASGD
jgi:oligopeptide/dipeptide ABC transporter ATP-binding protein